MNDLAVDLFDAPPTTPRCYADIKRLAQALGRNIPDLLGMAQTNDPFYIMPAQEKQAQWFADLWNRFDLPHGIHLRRIHYRLLSHPDLTLPDGRPYENTEKVWTFLLAASKASRCLSLVPPDAFIDARNPDPVLHRSYPPRDEPRLWFDDGGPWELPMIDAGLADNLDWTLPGFGTGGYTSSAHDDPFHLELISEKSTMDDIIVPLCKELAINYAPATGFQSITGAVNLLKRLRQADKPGVVFYVSDFDPAGAFMPASVARQLEYWRPVFAPGLDIVLLPAVLTKAQVVEFNLPPIPIKDSDKRQDNFLTKYGVQGATELDALEALHPGALARLLRQAVKPYRDGKAKYANYEIGCKADREIEAHWDAICRPYRWRMARLKEQAAEIVESYQGALQELRDAMDAELEPIKRELKSLRQAIKADADEFDPVLPDPYQSPLTLPERFDGLFDSRRPYLEQLRFYKQVAMEGDC